MERSRETSGAGRSGLAFAGIALGLLAGALFLGRDQSGAGEPKPGGPGASAETKPPAPRPAPSAKKPRPWSPPRFKDRHPERDAMVQVIRRYGLRDPAVLKAMAAVPRHEFVSKGLSRYAYTDTPLPIGHGQTISQPYIVAEMTRLLRLKPTSKVLEIGTGSGYQAAVLAEFTPHVYTVEIIGPLADSAKRRLKRLGYSVVKTARADGYHGWKEHAPFDGIIVTCAAGQVPPPLIKQLAPGGRMIIPVGPVYGVQNLMLVDKDRGGKARSRSLMAVRFVPLVRKKTGDE